MNDKPLLSSDPRELFNAALKDIREQEAMSEYDRLAAKQRLLSLAMRGEGFYAEGNALSIETDDDNEYVCIHDHVVGVRRREFNKRGLTAGTLDGFARAAVVMREHVVLRKVSAWLTANGHADVAERLMNGEWKK